MLRVSRIFTRNFTAESPARVLAGLKNPNLVKTQGFINGQWQDGSLGAKFKVTDPALYPAKESFIAEVSSMSHQDYENAIQAAYKSFQLFKKTTGRQRSQWLLNLYNLMVENKDDLAKLIVLENGKPYADALGEVMYSASFFQWYAEEAPRINGDVLSSSVPGNKILTLKQPIGVCGILVPWNFPSAMIARKLAAAFAVGCTSVVKPASETPLSATALAYLAHEAGFPAGLVNVLPSDDAAGVGTLICEHPLIKKVSFTGSTNVGKILMSQSSSTLKKLSFELGGNAPLIVFDDADIDKAVAGAIASKFRSSGQTCVCANRIYIHESIYDEFARKFVEKVRESTTLGNGLDPDVTHGPVIHNKSLSKVRSHIDDAVSRGAEILLGGKHRTDIGENFHDLTILGDVPKDLIISKEETFGPVCPLIKFSSDEEVIALANDTQFGLAGYFFSKDIQRIFNTAEELQAGIIGVNTGLVSEAAMPFGGIAESGFGKEGSVYGVDDYLITKSVVLGGLN